MREADLNRLIAELNEIKFDYLVQDERMEHQLDELTKEDLLHVIKVRTVAIIKLIDALKGQL